MSSFLVYSRDCAESVPVLRFSLHIIYLHFERTREFAFFSTRRVNTNDDGSSNFSKYSSMVVSRVAYIYIARRLGAGSNLDYPVCGPHRRHRLTDELFLYIPIFDFHLAEVVPWGNCVGHLYDIRACWSSITRFVTTSSR